MTRRFGIDVSKLDVGVAQREQFAVGTFHPLPPATGLPPFRATQGSLGIEPALGGRTIYVIGDHGGVLQPERQQAVAAAMAGAGKADFIYSVGDVVYFNGENAGYGPQFGEPYSHVPAPILAIPGNHDGDPLPGTQSLDAFVATFCAPSPGRPGWDTADEYGRDTETQPNVYWTLEDECVTIIGLYSNVPSGGVIEADQADWLAGEVANARNDLPLIVALHHPPYSCDAHHGGSAKMGVVLDSAFGVAHRWPELVLSGHVHNYQRFSRVGVAGKIIPYIVNGAGGYHHLHAMVPGTKAPMSTAVQDLTLQAFCDDQWGFLILDIVGGSKGIVGEYVGVAKDGTVTRGVDHFTV